MKSSTAKSSEGKSSEGKPGDGEEGASRVQEIARLVPVGARVFSLVFSSHPWATSAILALTLVSGLLPAAIAWVGKQIVDHAVGAYLAGPEASLEPIVSWVLLELGLVALQQLVSRGLWLTDSLLRTVLGQDINERILEKALTLELSDVEDSETYDLMSRARRGASYQPLSFVIGGFGLIRNVIALVGYGALLWQLAPWALVLVVLAAVPAFLIETKFSEDSFRLFRWRAPETRKQNYLESVIARQDHTKEVKLFDLGELFLGRYRAIFKEHYARDRDLTIRQAVWGYLLGLIGLSAFYGCYAWVALATVRGELTFGDMTLYVLIFREAQQAIGMVLGQLRQSYEELLYVSELFAFLDLEPTQAPNGTATEGPTPSDGLRFEDVSFTYPGADKPVLAHIDLHLAPGHKLALVGENGAGKTTLIKLMTGLYRPTEGRVLLDGLPIEGWDPRTLRRRMGVIFQDFVRYQLVVGENIGVGDVRAIEDEGRWKAAAQKGLAHEMIQALPAGYQTQLGKWFDDGQELSGGQWQKVALSRAFMREDADILVLDEPTAAMDAEAETKIFERFQALAEDRMAILISHRFSTVRMADTIAVLHDGKVVERGSHEALLAQGGRYARLFLMQAKGYR